MLYNTFFHYIYIESYFIIFYFNNNRNVVIYNISHYYKKMKSDGFASLKFYGITKDPETKEFIMIVQFIKKVR